MRVVQFRDGKYGVRRGFWPFFQFKDLQIDGPWWSADNKWIKDCKTDDLEEARRLARPDYGKVVE